MGRLIFVLGGARSGKSKFAQTLAKRLDGQVVFIATCIPKDREMKKRVSLHKKHRPRHWRTIEDKNNILQVLKTLRGKPKVIIIDCLGLFISNLLAEGKQEKFIEREVKGIAQKLSKSNFLSIVVSNEVGGGIVPINKLARNFRDITGMSNQIMASYADTVYVLHAGIPTPIKGGKKWVRSRKR